MANITFRGNPIQTVGHLPTVGSKAPDFKLVAGDLSEATLATYSGKTVILNIVPSLDTGVCQLSAKAFNARAGNVPSAVIVNVSMDLPFAQKRFCDSEKLDHVSNLSGFRSPDFGKDYGVSIVDGPIAGLYSRAVVVIRPDGKIAYTQQVPEIGQEPDYDAVMAAIQ